MPNRKKRYRHALVSPRLSPTNRISAICRAKKRAHPSSSSPSHRSSTAASAKSGNGHGNGHGHGYWHGHGLGVAIYAPMFGGGREALSS